MIARKIEAAYQTCEVFYRFKVRCVGENTSTAVLVRRLISEHYDDKAIASSGFAFQLN